MRCGYIVLSEVSGDVCEDEIPGWALKSKSTNYPDHGHHGDLPLPGKIPMGEPGIKPGTSWLVVRNLDHVAGLAYLVGL